MRTLLQCVAPGTDSAEIGASRSRSELEMPMDEGSTFRRPLISGRCGPDESPVDGTQSVALIVPWHVPQELLVTEAQTMMRHVAALHAAKETEMIATTRPSQRQLAKAENVRRRADMEREIADGRLVVRTMTRCERDQSDARWTAAAKARDSRGKRRRYGEPR